MPGTARTSPARRSFVIVAVAIAAAGALLGASTSQARTATTPSGWVHQVGTYDYLVQPDFDAVAPLADVVGNSTIGLGTFDQLDGELVLVRGTVYRVGTDGTPQEVSLDRTTPFFQGVRFSAQEWVTLATDTACSDLIPIIDAAAGAQDGIVAVRINGTFSALTTRSVPKQDKPYPPLSEVVAEQVEFPMTDRKATLVGFRQGSDMLGVGQPGLHLHGLTRDGQAGGHVLSCTVGSGARMAIQQVRGVKLLAPSGG